MTDETRTPWNDVPLYWLDSVNWDGVVGEPDRLCFDCGEHEADEQLRELSDIDEWRYEYVFPGNPSWSRGTILVCATPDHEGLVGEVSVEAHDGGECVASADLPYDLEPGEHSITAAAFMELVKPLLTKPFTEWRT